ncbi:uncharacterized protein V6R79_015398 [Siganus canaliculatus]
METYEGFAVIKTHLKAAGETASMKMKISTSMRSSCLSCPEEKGQNKSGERAENPGNCKGPGSSNPPLQPPHTPHGVTFVTKSAHSSILTRKNTPAGKLLSSASPTKVKPTGQCSSTNSSSTTQAKPPDKGKLRSSSVKNPPAKASSSASGENKGPEKPSALPPTQAKPPNKGKLRSSSVKNPPAKASSESKKK